MSESDLKSYLAEHPRMIGALFTMTLLLSQAGNAAAGAVGGTAGP
jgi:hypothetical protein